jgi:hypothetical protein
MDDGEDAQADARLLGSSAALGRLSSRGCSLMAAAAKAAPQLHRECHRRYNLRLAVVLILCIIALPAAFLFLLSHSTSSSSDAEQPASLLSLLPDYPAPVASSRRREPALFAMGDINSTAMLSQPAGDARSDRPTSPFIFGASIDHSRSADAFSLLDDAFVAAGRWPRVDLFVRTYHGAVVLLPLLFHSIARFWPRNVGRCVVVLDANDPLDQHSIGLGLAPDWCELQYERVPDVMAANGRWAQQWSNLWLDNYTTPDTQFVVITDTDAIFIQKVTPDLLFDRSGRALHPISPHFQRGMFDAATRWWLGEPQPEHELAALYPLNYMQNLPQVFPVETFAAFRRHVLQRHARLVDSGGPPTFDAVNAAFLSLQWAEGEQHEPSQFCLLGNYLQYFAAPELRSRVRTVLTDHSLLPPAAAAVDRAHEIVLRSSMHVPYTELYMPDALGGSLPRDYERLYDVALSMMRIGLCALQPLLSCRVSEAEWRVHAHQLLIYAVNATLWSVAVTQPELVHERVLLQRWRWLRQLAQTARRDLQAAAASLQRWPDAVAYDTSA